MEDRVLVVGGGAMGSGIAFVAARAGFNVEVVEPDAAARQRALERIARGAERAGDASIPGSVRFSGELPTHSDASVAIEAVPESFELKRDVIARLATALDPQALLATNTSSLSVSELAEGAQNPERILGMHFFNPPAAMALIEVVYAAQTGDEPFQRAMTFVQRLGKTAVETADSPGFIVNRVARPYYLQSLRALESGVASVEELDALARSAGFRMGPFELMDFIGIDVNLATSDSIYARTEEARLEPVEAQREMVSQGLLGRKSGAGFYDYRNGDPERLDVAAPALEGPSDDQESIVLLGFGGLADELAELLLQRYARVARVENDDLLDEISLDTTIVFDAGGDGETDRGEVLAALDSLLGPEAVFFADAYATDLRSCAKRMQHPERLVGYGVLGSFQAQDAVEVVDAEAVSDDALELAQELFETIGKGVVLVEDVPGLFLGRTIGSIVNEAVIAVDAGIASADDVDTAMRLGTNYPIGPIAWGREIGGKRIARILNRLAAEEGSQFGPHRALWVLDVEETPADAMPAEASAP